MFHNMLMTAFTPLSVKNEADSWENRPFRTVWPEKQQHKVKEITRTIKKKPKRVRTAFSTDQIRTLEKTYARYKYINSDRRAELAKSLDIGEKCIKIWFQNRRMKEKKESSESSCESSSESQSNETSSESVSPPPSVNLEYSNTPPPSVKLDYVNTPPPSLKPEYSNTEYSNQYYRCNNSEYSYQLPTYYGMNLPQNMYVTVPHEASTFCNDNNVYPTYYYPVDNNYAATEDNLNNYNGHDLNQYWMSNQNSYYPM